MLTDAQILHYALDFIEARIDSSRADYEQIINEIWLYMRRPDFVRAMVAVGDTLLNEPIVAGPEE